MELIDGGGIDGGGEIGGGVVGGGLEHDGKPLASVFTPDGKADGSFPADSCRREFEETIVSMQGFSGPGVC
jgi:hypothetical protein